MAGELLKEVIGNPGPIQLMGKACDFCPNGCKMATLPPGITAAFQAGGRGKGQRVKDAEVHGECILVFRKAVTSRSSTQ